MVGVTLFLLMLNAFYVARAQNVPILFVNSANTTGGFMSLHCTANVSTNSIGFYKFWKDGVNITSYKKLPFHIIHSLQTKDSGNYSCSSKVNETETTSIVHGLKVYLHVVFISNPNGVEGKNHNLTCFVNGGEAVQYFVWKKAGVVIPSENSSNLLLKNVSRQEEGDIYQCSAIKANGERSNEASVTFSVWWIDPPSVKISRNVLTEGDHVSFQCITSANPGYPSNSGYKWFRNGERISLPVGFNNQLLFRDVPRNATGNYSCSMKHFQLDIEKISDAKSMTVLYIDKPYIVFNDNTSSTVIEGNRVSFSCRVDTYYHGLTLNYSWEVVVDIVGRSPDFVINSTTKRDEEYYRCIVIGSLMSIDITKNAGVRLIIHYPPKHVNLYPLHGIVKLKLNSSFRTKCSLRDYGKPKAALYWFRGNELAPFINGTQGKELYLEIPSLQHSHAENYTCQGLNYVDSVSKTVDVIVTERPGEMEPPVVVETDEHLITIRWMQPKFDGNLPVNTYNIQRIKKCESCNSSLQYNQVHGLTLRMIALTPGTVYQIRIQAINQVGTGPFSNFTEAATKPALKPYAPKEFKHILPQLSHAIMVEWIAPNNSDIIDYILGFLPSDGSGSKSYNQLHKTATNHTILNLEKYKAYNLTLYARNHNGDGKQAYLNNIFTQEEEPEMVRNINVVQGQKSLKVSWNPPNNIFGHLQAYSVCHKRFGSNDTLKCINTTSTTFNITNLIHAQLYAVQVKVFNSLFSSTRQQTKSTLGLAPPPIPSVPEPSMNKITRNTFAINIVQFDETNGIVQHYDVIVMPLPDNNIPNRTPNDFSNSEISDNVVGRLFFIEDNQQFIVGNGVITGRERRQLGTPHNPSLKENTIYTTFVRGYITESVYQSSPWYKPVKTKPSGGSDVKNNGLSDGAIVGIVFAVLFVCILIGVLVYVCSRTHHVNDSIHMTEFKNN